MPTATAADDLALAPEPLPVFELPPEFRLDLGEGDAAPPAPIEAPGSERVVSEAPLGPDFNFEVGGVSASAPPGNEAPAPAPAPTSSPDELPQIEDIDFGRLAALSADAPPSEPALVSVEPPAQAADELLAAAAAEVVELDATAWPSELIEAFAAAEAKALPDLSPLVEPSPVVAQETLRPDETELPLVDAKALEQPSAPLEIPDEQTRVIGSLRIGLRLYNVYLNEADE